MVREDAILEDETAQKGGMIKQWKKEVEKVYVDYGFLGRPDDDVDMDR